MNKIHDSDKNIRARRFLTRLDLRAAIPYLAVGLFLIIAIVAGGNQIEHHIHAIESWLTKLGPWGAPAFVAFFIIATSVLLPDTVLCIIAGALLGMGSGCASVLAGSLLAGAIQYALSHRLLRARVQGMINAKPSLAAIQRAVIRDEFRLQVLLRLTPLNPATVSYMLGAAGVRFPVPACLSILYSQLIHRGLLRARWQTRCSPGGQ